MREHHLRLPSPKHAQLLMRLLVIAALLVPVAVISRSQIVGAAQETITGRCWVELTEVSVNMGGTYAHAGFGVTMPDGQTVHGECIDWGKYCPLDGWYDFTATRNNDGSYAVVVESQYYASTPSDVHPLDRPYWGSSGVTQHVGKITWHPVGYIALRKASSNPGVSADNALYSIAGAEYAIYADSGCSHLVTTLKADGQGDAKSGELACGTYYVRETEAPQGFAPDSTVYTVSVNPGATAYVNGGIVTDTPLFNSSLVQLLKRDAGSSSTTPQGDAQLEGARYSVRYYDGIYANASMAQASGDPARSWVFQTGPDGIASFDSQHKAAGDDLYLSGSETVFPLGTLVVQEESAPAGYLRDDVAYVIRIVQDGDAGTALEGDSTPVQGQDGLYELVLDDAVITNGLSIMKRDAESQLNTALGGADVEGAEFTVSNASSHAVLVNGIWYEPGQDIMTLTSLYWDSNGDGQILKDGSDQCVATTDSDHDGCDETLPYGTYQVRETLAPEGYLPSSEVTTLVLHGNQGGVICPATADGDIDNQVVRGDIQIMKSAETSEQGLEGIPFLISLLNSKGGVEEQHVAVTDANGQLSTAASWASHAANTNGSDAAVTVGEDGSLLVNEELLDLDAGIWFGATCAGWSTEPDDGKGALPFGLYRIQELPVTANDGFQLVDRTVQIYRNGSCIAFDMDNTACEVSTAAWDEADHDKTLAAGEASIVDVVTCSDLVPGSEYSLEATLCSVEDGTVVATGSRTFTATAAGMAVNVPISADTSELCGSSLVVLEQLLDSQGRVIAAEESLDVASQILRVEEPQAPVEPEPEPEETQEAPDEPVYEEAPNVMPRTGDIAGPLALIAATLAAMGAMVALASRRARKGTDE